MGEIVELGDAVTTRKIGDRVGRRWSPMLMQLLPEGLSYERAAPVFCAAYTVHSDLRIAEPQPHERVAIVGVGGLGHLDIQYAKATSFETIAITHSKDKEELASKLGSDVVVSDGKGLKNSGRADVILATSNSYRARGDTLKVARWKAHSDWYFR